MNFVSFRCEIFVSQGRQQQRCVAQQSLTLNDFDKFQIQSCELFSPA